MVLLMGVGVRVYMYGIVIREAISLLIDDLGVREGFPANHLNLLN